MSIVSETLMSFLPSKRKTTPSGWASFNAPCCVHNGTSADTRMRAGIKEEADTLSYHCFNCGFKTSWQPGRHVSYKLKQLMTWLNVPDDVITKLSLEVLKINEGIEVTQRLVDLPTFDEVQLPPDCIKITDDSSNQKLEPVKDYLAKRQLHLDMGYDFYWSSSLGYRDRFVIPFYYEDKIVGWTARTITADKKPKYITESQPGFVFNLDEQRPQKVFCIVVEGPIDALHIDGVALMRAEINDQQAMLIDRLNKDTILLPDRDDTGAALVEQAISREWSVSMPEWAPDIKDVNDAVLRYGRLYTLYSIVSAAESSPLKIRLRAKKWYAK